MRITVENRYLYEDDKRKVECVRFTSDEFGILLVNKAKKNYKTNLVLSGQATRQIIKGLKIMLKKPTATIREQHFIDVAGPEFVWAECPPPEAKP